MNQLSVLVVLLVVFSSLVMVAVQMRHRSTRATYGHVVSALRWWMVPAAFAALTATGLASWLLLSVPDLRWSWWSALGGSGNVSLGQTAAAAPSGGGTGENFVRLGITALGIIIPLGVVAGVPMLAWQEEFLFRRGTEHFGWLAAMWRSLQFGLIHLFAGVPTGVALALTLAGLAFHLVYRAHAPRHLPADLARPSMGAVVIDRDLDAAELGSSDHIEARQAMSLVEDRTEAKGHRPAGAAQRTPGIDALQNFLHARERYDDLISQRERGRDQATYSSAAFHAVYNWLALTVFVVVVWVL